MTEWRTRRLDELCSMRVDQASPVELQSERYVAMEHVDSGRVSLSRWGVVDGVRSNKSRFRKGDILYGKLRPYLDKAVIAPFDGVCSTELLPLEPKPSEIHPEYLALVLHTPDFISHAKATTVGVNHPRTSWISIARFEAQIPPLKEQLAVAAALKLLESAVRIEERLVDAVRALKSAVMAKLFREGLRGEPLKQTEIGSVPQNWRVDRLVEFAHFQRGYDITKKDQKRGTVPVVSSGGTKSWHDVAAAKGPGVVIGRKGSIGELHYVEQDFWPHDTTLFATDFRGNLPRFVYYRLSVLDLKRLDSGAANPALNRNFLHQELISWPDPDEQRSIATTLQTIDRSVSIHNRKRQMLQELFTTMLQHIMTGTIRVEDLNLAEVSRA